MKNLNPLFLFSPADGEAAGSSPAAAAADQAAAAGVPNDRAEQKAAAGVMKSEALAAAADSVGIQGALAVVDFLDSLVAAVVVAEADGKITVADLLSLKDVIPTVQPMLAGLHEVPDELKDLDANEIEALIAEAAKAFPGSDNAKVVLKVKAALAWAKASYDVFLAFKK